MHKISSNLFFSAKRSFVSFKTRSYERSKSAIIRMNNWAEGAYVFEKIQSTSQKLTERAIYRVRGKSNTEELNSAEIAVTQLSKSIAAMGFWGLGNAILISYAPQLSLAALVAFTWGSFRWNENELLKAGLSALKTEGEVGRMYTKNKLHYTIYFCVLLLFYCLFYMHARAPISDTMREKFQNKMEESLPFLASLNFKHHKTFHTQILKQLPDESKEGYLNRFNQLALAVEKGDAELIISSNREFCDFLQTVYDFESFRLIH